MRLVVFGATSECVAVVPGQPVDGSPRDFAAISNELGEVMEGIDAVELGGMNEAEEDVSDLGAVFRLVEQRVLSMCRQTGD